jgi:hypothetical protein
MRWMSTTHWTATSAISYGRMHVVRYPRVRHAVWEGILRRYIKGKGVAQVSVEVLRENIWTHK